MSKFVIMKLKMEKSEWYINCWNVTQNKTLGPLVLQIIYLRIEIEKQDPLLLHSITTIFIFRQFIFKKQ